MKSVFTVETSKIVGTPADGCWSQVHTFSPEEEEKKQKRGELLAVLVVCGVAQGIEAVSVGREILGRFHEEYYGNLSGSAFERLKVSVKKVCEENGGLEMVAASVVGEALNIAISGNGRVLLKRENKFGLLLKGDGGFQTASGFLQQGDFLLFGSGRFFGIVAEGVIRAAFETGTLQEADEIIAPIIVGRDDAADSAAVLAVVNEEKTVLNLPVVGQKNNENLGQETGFKETDIYIKNKISSEELSNNQKLFIERGRFAGLKRKFLPIIIVILVILVGLGIFFFVRSRVEKNNNVQAKVFLTTGQEKFNQGKQIFLSDPQQGKNLVNEAKDLVSKSISIDGQNQETKLLQEQIEKYLSNINLEIDASKPLVYLDLSSLGKEVSGLVLTKTIKGIVVLDQGSKKVFFVDENKKSEAVDFPAEGSQITACKDRVFVLSDKGIFEIEKTNKKSVLKVKTDAEWGEVLSLACFNNNLYLLDKGKNLIWRYAWIGSNFGEKRNWLGTNTYDFSSSICMSIDGSVWILNKDKIEKFSLGKKEEFTTSNLPYPFSEVTKIYTSDKEQNLYVLDKGMGRIYVFGKDGNYKTAYFGEEIKNATDFIVNEVQKKIFLLSSSKIFEIELK